MQRIAGTTSEQATTVAAAAEEMTTSINEISGQVARGSEITAGAVVETERVNSEMQGLADSAGKIDEVVTLITDIASNGSLLLISREPEGWEEINYPQLETKLYQLDEVVSRKKQLLPLIISLLESSPVTSR